jgi:tetratricopeptide (TPR) repeat protein
MVEKNPSSLDYASLLHELTLKKWMESILENEWRRAEIAAGKLSESPERFWSWLGSYNMAVTYLCRGKSDRALESLAVAAEVYAEASHLVASARIMTSYLLIEMGRLEQADDAAKQATHLCSENPLVYEALFFCGQSRLRQGHLDEAEKLSAQLREHVKGRVRHHQLQGEIALKRGEPAGAVRELEKADALLEESTRESFRVNLSVPVRFSLSVAYLDSQQTSAAIQGLDGIVRDKRALLDWPIPYVRSFFHLGMEYQQRGERSKALQHLGRFVQYWKGGVLDTEKVQQAERLLSV